MLGRPQVRPGVSDHSVNKIAWSEKVYRVASAESGEMGARFGLEGWPEKVVYRDLRKSPKLFSQTVGAGGAAPAEATERPQAPTSLFQASPRRPCHLSQTSAEQARPAVSAWPGCEEP